MRIQEFMARAPRWETTRAALPADMPETVRESVRRLGARDRHEARVRLAGEWLSALWSSAEPMPSALVAAIRAAADASGAPGSACGSAPPGLLRGTPHVGAWITAIHEALASRPCQDYGPPAVGVDGEGLAVRWEGVESALVLDLAEPLAEHLLAVLARDEARAILAAVEAGEDPTWTSVHELHAATIAVRRDYPAAGGQAVEAPVAGDGYAVEVTPHRRRRPSPPPPEEGAP